MLRLHFQALPEGSSAILPARVRDVVGTTGGGLRLANGLGQNGRLFVVGEEPVLDALLATKGDRSLVLYGRPGRAYAVESATNLALGAAWRLEQAFELDGRFTVLPLEAAGPGVFYRAVEQDRARGRLAIRQEGSKVVLRWPSAAGECAVEEAGSLTPPVRWRPLTDRAQVVGDRYHLVQSVGASVRFYRLQCPEPARR